MGCNARKKIGLLLPQYMLHIFESLELIRELATKSSEGKLEPIFSDIANNWNSPSEIRDISQAYLRLASQEGMLCILVFGDDASATLFDEFNKGLKETVPVATVLSGIDVDHNLPLEQKHLKFWFTQEYEALLLLNWLLEKKEKRKDEELPIVSLVALNAMAPKEHCAIFKKLICEQYNVFRCDADEPFLWEFGAALSNDAVRKILKSDAIFISGYADGGHIDLIKRLIENDYSGYVLTNVALSTERQLALPQKRLPFKDNAIFYTGVGSADIQLFYNQLIQTIFGYLADISARNLNQSNTDGRLHWQDARTFASPFGAALDIAENGNMSLPLSRWKMYYDNTNCQIIQEPEYTPKSSFAGFTEIASFLHYLSKFALSLVHCYQGRGDVSALVDSGRSQVDDLNHRVRKFIDPVGQDEPNVFFISLEHGETLTLDSTTDKCVEYTALLSFIMDCIADKDVGEVVQINLKKEDFPNNSSTRFWIECDNGKFVTIAQWLDDNNLSHVKSLRWTKTRNILAKNEFHQLKHHDDSDYKTQEYIALKKELLQIRTDFASNFLYIILCDIGIKDNTGAMLLFQHNNKFSHAILQALLTASRQLFTIYYNAKSAISLREANTRSAIGSIMSRNGSHNIGSHVLAALTHNVGTMPDDRVLYQYIQQRMDYIATVTTDFPSWGTPTMFVGDMMKTFFSQRHLLEYIAGSEGLHAYRFQDPGLAVADRRAQSGTIKLHIRRIHENIRAAEEGRADKMGRAAKWEHAENARDHVLHFIHYPDRKNIHFIDYHEDASLPLEHDVALAIPGGVIGEHAFFTILENVIRNAAKHGWAAADEDGRPKNMEIYVDFLDDPASDYVDFTVWDNMSDVLRPLRRDKATAENYARFLNVLGNVPDEVSAKLNKLNGKRRAEWIREKFQHLPEKLLLCSELAECFGKFNEAGSDDEKKSLEAEIQRLLERLSAVGVSDVSSAENADAERLLKRLEDEMAYCVAAVSASTVRREFENFLQTELTGGEIEALLKAAGEDTPEWERVKLDDLPLHWRQQALLTKPLITEQGELRRENWGLAEMKISAGYLMRRSIAEIGGLESDTAEGKPHIILPVAMPGVCDCEGNPNGGIRCAEHRRDCSAADCPIINKRFHLGYRFSIPKPREMLIVLPDWADVPAEPAEFKKQGIYFAKAENAECYFLNVNDKGELDCSKPADFNFEYVVFPDEDTAKECGEALLKKYKADKQQDGVNDGERWKAVFPFRLLCDNNIPTDDPANLKDRVYELWMNELKDELRPDLQNATLALQIQTIQTEGGGSGGGRGLITDRDLLRFVLNNNYRAAIGDLAGEDMPQACRNILKLLALYPSGDDELPEAEIGDIYGRITELLRNRCAKLRDNYGEIYRRIRAGKTGRENAPDPDGSDFVSRCLERIDADGNAADIIRGASPELFEEQMEIFTGKRDDDFDAFDILFGGNSDGGDSPVAALTEAEPTVLDRLAKVLRAAYRNADTLLRKYEERIITLPHGYSADKLIAEKTASGGAGEKSLCDRLHDLGIELNRRGSSPLIKYCRHDNSLGKGTAYAEALSGSQSYLNMLHRALYKPDEGVEGLFVRLVENAFIRLLVIDERVCNFLKAHSANLDTFMAMNIDVADISDKCDNSGVYDQNSQNVDLEKLNLCDIRRKEREWDMLIIHQGVIDKWFPADHGKAAVGKFIESLQQAVKYTVVTTGRGRPDNIPDHIKVIPFSMIESTLFRNYPEKLLLVNAVMNSLPNRAQQ